MKIKSIKEFISKSSLPSKLIRSVIRQIGGWESFKESAQDITNYGLAGSYSGFIYYTETVAFTKRNKEEIDLLLKDLASDLGESFSELLCSFNCLKGYYDSEILDGYYNPRSENRAEVYNALSWFALEEVARSYVDLIETEDEY